MICRVTTHWQNFITIIFEEHKEAIRLSLQNCVADEM